MKKAANILLTITKILGIFGFVAFILSAIGFAIGAGSFFEAAANATVEDDIAAFTVAGGTFVGAAVTFLFLSPLFLIDTIVASKAKNRLASAKSKSDIKGIAIASIIFGALGTTTLLLAGIFMLVSKEKDYNQTVIDC